MNFRHSFEPGLAQFSPVLLFELSRGALQTRPEGERAPIPRDCDTLWEPTCARDVWKLETVGKTDHLHFAEEFGKEGEWSWFLSAVVSYLGFQSASQYFSSRQSLTHTYTRNTLGSLCSEYLPWLITQKKQGYGEREMESRGSLCVLHVIRPVFPALMIHLSKSLLPILRWKFAFFRLPTAKLRLATSGHDLSSVALGRLL